MKFKSFIFTLLLLLYSTSFSKTLIVAEYRIDKNKVGNYTYLYGYKFQKGKFLHKTKIFGAPTFRKGIPGSYVRYDLGTNFIYQNRYVISGVGNVIDLKKRKLVVEESDDFIKAKGNILVFHRNNLYGSGYKILNLNTGSYTYAKNFKNLKGIPSPDFKYGLLKGSYYKKNKFYYQIYINNRKNQSKIIVKNAGVGTILSKFASTTSKVPMLWINKSNFIYAHYSKINKNYKVNLRLVNINGKTKSVKQIKNISPSRVNSSFSKDKKNRIIFTCSTGIFIVNINNGQLSLTKENNLWNSFSVDINNNGSNETIRFNNKIIGKFWCSAYQSETTEGYIATEYGPSGSNLGYPKGIKIWNKYTKKWITIDIPWVCDIIGWIE